eukprot:3972198-Pleurochrysis_carterae.AAC.1
MRDRFGNPTIDGVIAPALHLVGGDGDEMGSRPLPQLRIAPPRANGVVGLTFTPTAAGAVELHIKLNGVALTP